MTGPSREAVANVFSVNADMEIFRDLSSSQLRRNLKQTARPSAEITFRNDSLRDDKEECVFSGNPGWKMKKRKKKTTVSKV